MIPAGLGISTAVLVGNNIGQMNIEVAKYFGKLCFSVGLCWSVASFAAIHVFKSNFIQLFSTIPNVN